MNRDPFRIFFPLGIFFLFLGVLIWIPRIWDAENYPVILHRTLVLNGFVTCFIGGFLFTAAPRFSKTDFASTAELTGLFSLIAAGIVCGWMELEKGASVFSGMTALFILGFLLRRMLKRKANPPFTFLFLPVGLGLWIFSSFGWAITGTEELKELHYHGAVMAIILGVGGRLLPGIMGHIEIQSVSRVPKRFIFLVVTYIASFFLPANIGPYVSAVVVAAVALGWWKLWKLPPVKSALTMCLWICGWLIVLSYLLRAFWQDGMIHGSHAFFINGLVLLSLLVATRVIQSHGPQDMTLENWKGLYVVTGIIFFSSLTRVTAYLMPEHYLSHLGYASIILVLGVLIWAGKYLKYVREVRS